MKLIYFLRIIIASFEDNEEEIEKKQRYGIQASKMIQEITRLPNWWKTGFR